MVADLRAYACVTVSDLVAVEQTTERGAIPESLLQPQTAIQTYVPSLPFFPFPLDGRSCIVKFSTHSAA